MASSRSIEDIIASFAYKADAAGGGDGDGGDDDDGGVNHHDGEATNRPSLSSTLFSPSGIRRCTTAGRGRSATSFGAGAAGRQVRRKRGSLSESTMEDDAEKKEKRRRGRPPTITKSNKKKESHRKPVVIVSRFFPRLPDAVTSSSSLPSSLVVVDEKRPLIAARKKPKAGATSSGLITACGQRKHCPGRKNADDSGSAGEAAKDQEERSTRNMRKRKNAACSQLSAAEKMSDAYRRVAADSMWEPPASCHHLLQERHSFDPWRVLVICMLLNVTTGRQVGKVLPGLFLLCPDAETTTKVNEEEIEKVIQTLGLQRKRARMIKQFSCEYLGNEWTHVTQLHGIGKYAADAYAIFCVGKPQEVVPQDHKLVEYWKFVCGKTDTK